MHNQWCKLRFYFKNVTLHSRPFLNNDNQKTLEQEVEFQTQVMTMKYSNELETQQLWNVNRRVSLNK